MAAIIGLITVVVSLIVVLIEKNKVFSIRVTAETKHRLKKVWKIIIPVLIVIFVLVSAYWLTRSPSLTISSLSNGDVVGMEQQVMGVAKNIPDGSKVWIVIHVGYRYYPQPEPRIDNNGRWTCDIRFGRIEDGGLAFDIIALFADRDTQITLTENGELLVFPPLGAKEYDRITVTRETYSTASKSTSKASSVTIISPVNNAKVGIWELVNGISKNIPVGQELWLVVRVDGLYFPHKVETVNADGTWSHNVQIGQNGEGGKSFDLIAVLADSSAQVVAQKWIENKDTSNHYNLTELPLGMTQYSVVTVIRK